MGYSPRTHALISYVEGNLENFDIHKMAQSFGFSDAYLRELFLQNVNMPIMQYYKKRKMIASAFELLHSNKTILTIALESGFSNHESYTRAFQKIFGMLPSQFRKERPFIGRKQLDVGVFGLERLSKNEKRSDDFMIKENNEKTILYGIRKIEQGAYGSHTMFPICVKAVSEYLGDDFSYAHIMAGTGAAFRLIWNQSTWDLSNIDIYHTLTESNEIYQYGAKTLGREFSFLGREDKTSKEDFSSYMKSVIAKGYPVIALGIIGPPEPCIVAGFESNGDIVMGWNFFQNDPEFSSAISTMDNGYFACSSWWENTDTQAVMHIGDRNGAPYSDKEIMQTAIAVMEGREEKEYAKGLLAYDAWHNMLLDEKWFKNDNTFDNLFTKLLVQNDAMACISDGRIWAAKYFEELSANYDSEQKNLSLQIAGHFEHVSSIANEMMSLLLDWENTEKMLQDFKTLSIRKKLCEKIIMAKAEDGKALEKMKKLYTYL